MFIRNEDFKTFLKLYPIVSIIIAIHIIVFLALNFLPGRGYLLLWGVGSNIRIQGGEFYRLVTPIFMHHQFSHFLFNTFSLFLFAPALERLLGKIRFIIGYLGAGILANLATYWVGGAGYPPHLGASGAIFGLFGIYLYIVIYRKSLIDQANKQIIVTILVISLIMTFLMPNISVLGHLFGLIGGAALSPLLLTGIGRRL
jgi:rhomboid protease GluP